MITTRSLQELWQQNSVVVLCCHGMLEAASLVAVALQWKTGVDVFVKVMPPESLEGHMDGVALFNPAGRIGRRYMAALPDVIEEYYAQEKGVRIRIGEE
jgi:hypothetical protein